MTDREGPRQGTLAEKLNHLFRAIKRWRWGLPAYDD